MSRNAPRATKAAEGRSTPKRASPATAFLPALLVAISLTLFPGSMQAAERVLYVDAVNGSDTATGASEAAPLRTIEAAIARMGEWGEEEPVTLYLACGSVFREEVEAADWNEYNNKVRRHRPHLSIRAYGEGPKPTISGMDPIPNEEFQPYNAERYPNVWAVELNPPTSYNFFRHGLIVDESLPFHEVILQNKIDDMKTFPGRSNPVAGKPLPNEEAVLAYLNETPETFYVRLEDGGRFRLFMHHPEDPRKDGRGYQYVVRTTNIQPGLWNDWHDIRFIGLNNRNGVMDLVPGVYMIMDGVEVLFGTVHNILTRGYRFSNMLSVSGREGTAYHAHSPGTHLGIDYGALYDKCKAVSTSIAFYDHTIGSRPFIYLRDSVTEDSRTLLNHGISTRDCFIIGHKHEGLPDPESLGVVERHGFSHLGALGTESNFIEDSILRFYGISENDFHTYFWPDDAKVHQHSRNSIFYTRANQDGPIAVLDFGERHLWKQNKPRPWVTAVDVLYENCTMVVDMDGHKINLHYPAIARVDDEFSGRVVLRNSILVVMNAPGVILTPDGDGAVLRFEGGGKNFEWVLDNCVVTFLEAPESAGKPGEDYVFATVEEIFEGDPAAGDFRIRPGSVADTRDVGFRPGREPKYRPLADALVEVAPEQIDKFEMSFDPETNRLALSSGIPGAEIFHTLDGSEPTTKSTQYTEPVALSEPTRVRAMASLNGVRLTRLKQTIAGLPKVRSVSGESLPLRVHLLDAFGEPLAGYEVEIHSSREDDKIIFFQGERPITGSDGSLDFGWMPGRSGPATVQVRAVETDGKPAPSNVLEQTWYVEVEK